MTDRFAYIGPYWLEYSDAVAISEGHRASYKWFKELLAAAIACGNGVDATRAAAHMRAHKTEFIKWRKRVRTYAAINRSVRLVHDLVVGNPIDATSQASR